AGRHAHALHDAHERLVLSGLGTRARCRVLRLRVRTVARLLRCPGPQDLPLLAHPPVAAVRGAADRPLPAMVNTFSRRRLLLAGSATLAVASLSACSDSPQSFKGIDITGADYATGFS